MHYRRMLAATPPDVLAAIGEPVGGDSARRPTPRPTSSCSAGSTCTKVGHHGSRNATLKTLFNLWLKPENARRDMVATMSTMDKSGHGLTEETNVPRATLVAALRQRMRLYDTDTLAPHVDFVELTADLANGGRFRKTPVPMR